MKKVLPVLLAIILALTACGSQEGPKKVESTESKATESSAESKAKEPTFFKKGETAELNGVQATLVEVQESKGNDINKPKDGNIFVLPFFEIANNGKEKLNISSMMSFSAYVDGYAAELDIGALVENKGSQLDGEVAPGKKLKGAIGLQAPKNYKDIEIHFSPSMGGDAIIFKYTK